MSDAERPRRLHPMSLVIDAVKSARGIAIPAIIGVLAATRGDLKFIGIAILVAPLIALVLPALRWRAFTYRIDAGALTIEQGLTNRSRRTIPLDLIQDISLEQGVAERILGLAKVKIETGGGIADEGLLDSVALSEARRLRDVLQRTAIVPAADHCIEPEEEPLFAMRFGRVVLVGFFNFSLLWLVAVLWLAGKADDALELDWASLADMAEHEALARLGLGAAVALALLVLVLTVIGGIARAIVRYAGFHLTHRDGRFRVQHGLFARRDTVILDRRIQLAQLRTGPIRRWLGWQSLEFQTLGGSDGPSGRLEVAPLARSEETAAILDAAGIAQCAEEWTSVGRVHGLATALRRGLPIIVGFGLGGWFAPWAWLGLLLLAPVIAVAMIAPRHHLHALREADMQVTRGVLKQRTWILPYPAVQVVSIRQGPLQRLLGIATVSPDTAGAKSGPRPELVDLPTALAVRIGHGLIAKA